MCSLRTMYESVKLDVLKKYRVPENEYFSCLYHHSVRRLSTVICFATYFFFRDYFGRVLLVLIITLNQHPPHRRIPDIVKPTATMFKWGKKGNRNGSFSDISKLIQSSDKVHRQNSAPSQANQWGVFVNKNQASGEPSL